MKIIKHTFTVTVEVVDKAFEGTPDDLLRIVGESIRDSWDSRMDGPLDLTVVLEPEKPAEPLPNFGQYPPGVRGVGGSTPVSGGGDVLKALGLDADTYKYEPKGYPDFYRDPKAGF